MNKRRVVVTGLGMITPVGLNVEESWRNILAGVSGVGPVEDFDTSDYSTKIWAKVKNLNIEDHMSLKDARKMDLFTGSLNNLEWKPKTERRPLFSPLVGLTHIYGSPVMTSEYESRFIPSRERRNEKPFQETRVTPGLNLGYNEVGKSSYETKGSN